MIPARIDRNSFNTLMRLQEDLVNARNAQPRKAQPQTAEFASNSTKKVQQTFNPAVDIYEDANAIVISVDLPGLVQTEIDIEMVDETLTIRGERKRALAEPNGEANAGKYIRSERQYGAFERRFTIAVPVQADHISATYRNGSLEVRVPKAEAVKPKKVLVNAE